MKEKITIFFLSPLALENGRGGEISSMELASGLNTIFNVTFMDTNIIIDKTLLSKKTIDSKLKGLKRAKRLKFLTFHFFNKYFDFPYPNEIYRLYKIIKNHQIVYTSYHNIKQILVLIFFYLVLRNVNFIIGYRKPLYSDKIFSLYNLKYRFSLLFLSLVKKRFYHHALSRHAKDFLENYYDSKKVYHIVHGIDLNKFKNDHINKKHKDSLKFVYIGYLDDIHKGIKVLLEGIELFLKQRRDLKVYFEFCGMGPLEAEVRNFEKKYPNNFKFHGYIDNKDIANYYKRNDVYLFSSRREPFPRTIMEALASKLIIISSKTIGSIELLTGKDFGFFIDKISPEAIKEKLMEVYFLWHENPRKIIELQESARKYIIENYSISQEIKDFKNLISKIITIN